MVKYEFGVMSRKWSIEAEDDINAKVSMSIFIGKNIPIAVYSPITSAFLPKEMITNTFDPERIKAALKTIKEIDINKKEVRNNKSADC